MLLSIAGLSGESFELHARNDARVEDLWKEVEQCLGQNRSALGHEPRRHGVFMDATYYHYYHYEV